MAKIWAWNSAATNRLTHVLKRGSSRYSPPAPVRVSIPIASTACRMERICARETANSRASGAMAIGSPAASRSMTENSTHIPTVLVNQTTAFAGLYGAFTGPLVLDGSGNLFGRTTNGSSGAAIFELPYSAGYATTPTVLGALSCVNNQAPNGYGPNALFLDAAGNLYASAVGSGSGVSSNCSNPYYDGGTIFEVAKSDSGFGSLQAIYSFASDGGNYGGPDSVLLANPNGQLVGTLSGGARGNTGSVFLVTGPSVTAATPGSAGALQNAVPEPASMTVLGVGFAALLRLRRSRA